MSGERSFDVVVLGAGPAGEACAGRIADGGLSVALVESAAGRRRMLLLGLHAVEGAAATGGADGRGRAGPGRAGSDDGELDVEAALRRRDEVIHGRDDSSQMRGSRIVASSCCASGADRSRAPGSRRETTSSRRAARSWSRPARGRPCRRSPGCTSHGPGATARPRPPRRLPAACWSWAAASSAWSWRRPGRRWARRVLVESGSPADRARGALRLGAGGDALRERGVDVRTGAEATAVRRDDAGFTSRAGGRRLRPGRGAAGGGRPPARGRRDRRRSRLVSSRASRWRSTTRCASAGASGCTRSATSTAVPCYAHGEVPGASRRRRDPRRPARATQDGPGSPRVIFTDPRSPRSATPEARQASGPRRSRRRLPDRAGRGRELPRAQRAGTSRLVVDERRSVIVGATFTGPEVAESLHAATIAVVGEVPLERLWHAVPAFPTRSEVWLRLLEAYGL